MIPAIILGTGESLGEVTILGYIAGFLGIGIGIYIYLATLCSLKSFGVSLIVCIIRFISLKIKNNVFRLEKAIHFHTFNRRLYF